MATAVRFQLGRLAAELEAKAPHRDIRRSIVAPTPEELPGVLRRIRQHRDPGQPDIHLGGPVRQSVFLRAKEGR